MENHLKQALKLVKAQASVRVMTEVEMLSMAQNLALGIRKLHEEDGLLNVTNDNEKIIDPKTAIKERSITCLECLKPFRVLTKKHLQKHNLTPDEYREKYNYKRNMSLVCKSLQRSRRKKMHEMKLWERRGEN